MASGKNLTVYLTSDTSKFGRGLKAAETRLDKFRGGVRRAAIGIGVGLAAGVAAAGVAINEMTDAALQDEKRVAKLTQTMKRLNRAAQLPAVLDAIDSLQRLTGVAEDELTPAFEKFVIATKDVDLSQKLLATALDTSVGSGRDLESVAAAMAKALGPQGTTGALKRLVPGLDLAGLKAGDAAGVMKALGVYTGQAGARAATTAGKMDRLSVGIGEVIEAGGQGFLEGFTGPDVDQALENMENAEDDVKRVGEALGQLGSNALGWAGDFLNGLEAISLGVDQWSLDVTSKINAVLDTLNLISDEEGQRRSDREIFLQSQRLQAARIAVTGSAGFGGGNFTDPAQQLDTFSAASLYTVDPNRSAANSHLRDKRADARAAQREARTGNRP